MKKLYMILFIVLAFNSIIAQTTEKFSYKVSKYGSIIVTPNFDQSKSEGKRALISNVNDAYFVNKVYNEIRKVFSVEDFVKMSKESTFKIVISPSGDVLRCSFIIDPKDKLILTDTRLYQLYLTFMKIKFDMSKAKMVEDVYDGTGYDYTDINGRLLPSEYLKSSEAK